MYSILSTVDVQEKNEQSKTDSFRRLSVLEKVFLSYGV